MNSLDRLPWQEPVAKTSVDAGVFLLTINVPVVYMAQYVMVLRRARSITGGIRRGGSWKLRHFWALKWLRAKWVPFDIFVPWNAVTSCFLFYGMVWNGIPRVCFYFCITVFLFFSSVEWFRRELREFSVPWNSRNSIGTKHLFRLFRSVFFRSFFFRKFPALSVQVEL